MVRGSALRERRSAGLQRVPPRWTPPPSAGEGDPTDVIGRALITTLVAGLLHGIRTGEAPSPSFRDGLAAQAVLDAVLASSMHRAWIDVGA